MNNLKRVEGQLKRDISATLGKVSKEFTLENFFANRMMVVKSIRGGVKQPLFLSIQNATPFSDEEWSAFLNISSKSLKRYKDDNSHVFKPIHSEKIMEMVEVVYQGNEVFDTPEQFEIWLETPSIALGNMPPQDLLHNSYGKELVLAELHRIDHGVFV